MLPWSPLEKIELSGAFTASRRRKAGFLLLRTEREAEFKVAALKWNWLHSAYLQNIDGEVKNNMHK